MLKGDVSIFVFIVFGGSGSNAMCLFAETGIPSIACATIRKQDKLAYVFWVHEHDLIVAILANSRM